MNIHGEYRDVRARYGAFCGDSGWRSNAISEDLGVYLAALLKSYPAGLGGIQYMAVGNGASERDFKTRVTSFFQSADLSEPVVTGATWAWAKKIEPAAITYLDVNGTEVTSGARTNTLKIQVTFAPGEPTSDLLTFTEFAVLGIDAGHSVGSLFFIDYVNHEGIAKDAGMELSRTVRLSFPTGGD